MLMRALTLRTHIPRKTVLGSFQTGHVTRGLGREKVGAEPGLCFHYSSTGPSLTCCFSLFVFCFVSDCPGLSFNMKFFFFFFAVFGI